MIVEEGVLILPGIRRKFEDKTVFEMGDVKYFEATPEQVKSAKEALAPNKIELVHFTK
jgi:hypothetical protein